MRTGIDRHCGFTLTELAIVVAIVALLVGGTLLTLSAQNSAREINDTRRTLEMARDAIMGFAVANGRLPCPAVPSSSGTEKLGGIPGTCASYEGFVPAVTLGIGPTGKRPGTPEPGYLLDAWLMPIRYHVTNAGSLTSATNPICPATATTNVFTTAGGMKSVGLGCLAPDLNICNSSIGASPTLCAAGQLQSISPAVVYSTGKNFATALAVGADEQANVDNNAVFVAHEPLPAGTSDPRGEFDDIVIWISPYVLYNRLISAGAI